MLTGRSTKMKVDVCLAIVLKLLLAVDIKKVGVKEFWKYGSYSQFLGSDTNFLAVHWPRYRSRKNIFYRKSIW
jgi:hypothetical protein